MGGKIDHGPGNTRDVWSSEDGRGWKLLGDAPWRARADFGLASCQGHVFLVPWQLNRP